MSSPAAGKAGRDPEAAGRSPGGLAARADYRLLLDRLPHPHLLVHGSTVVHASVAACAQLALRIPAGECSLPLDALFDAESARRLSQEAERVLREKVFARVERLWVQRGDGTRVERDAEVVPVPGSPEVVQVCLGLPLSAHDGAAAETARRALLEASLRAIEAQERERARLSREIHDQIGQALSALALRLELLLRQHAIPEQDPQARMLQDILAEVLEQTRSMSLQLRPPQLDDFGLASALRSLLERMFANTPVHYDLEIEGGQGMPANRIALAAYRIIQEALTNVLRHAEARTLRVEVTIGTRGLSLSVIDDGIGFAPDAVTGEHLGLGSMRSRAESLGGHCRILSRVGLGTRVEAWLPWTLDGEDE
ncbi:MAG: hypothetical protein KatS3mg126_0865 [Lysobacteraceae bacterium]|nr:MAG: hypothetical protein KatS3mg126_0865 [Xanthomonadaceae bacterium]